MNVTHCNIDFLIIGSNEVVETINGFIKKFKINIHTHSAETYEQAKKIIDQFNIDYVLITSCSKQNNKEQLDRFNTLLKSRDCHSIIIIQDINKSDVEELNISNAHVIEEFTFDLFKRLIGYSIINKDYFIRDNGEVKTIYKDNFIATHDALTMLPNRLYSINKIEQALIDAKINHRVMGLFFIDLDGFKLVNDKAGHKAGDAILKEVSRRLINNTRVSDISARYGGDEFLVFLPHIRSRADAEIVANKLLETLSEQFVIKNEHWDVSASIGVAMYPDDGQTAEELIEHADAAMYLAKQSGKHTIRYYNQALNAEIEKKDNIIHEIREAIINNDFGVMLQPQHEIKTGNIIGVELFVRWIHPEKGVIYPNDFLPYILNTNYINSLGDLIVKKALGLYYELNQAGITDINIAINVEGRQFINDNFIQRISGLKRYGVNIKSLTIEITEDCFRTNFAIVKERLHKLSALGVKICLDDFGLGTSSITQLAQLPIDIVKLDNKLLCNTDEDENIKNAIISMVHGFGKKVMAKRIDDELQLQKLKKIGCDYGQGYCYEKPLSMVDFVQYVAAHKKAANN